MAPTSPCAALSIWAKVQGQIHGLWSEEKDAGKSHAGLRGRTWGCPAQLGAHGGLCRGPDGSLCRQVGETQKWPLGEAMGVPGDMVGVAQGQQREETLPGAGGGGGAEERGLEGPLRAWGVDGTAATGARGGGHQSRGVLDNHSVALPPPLVPEHSPPPQQVHPRPLSPSPWHHQSRCLCSISGIRGRGLCVCWPSIVLLRSTLQRGSALSSFAGRMVSTAPAQVCQAVLLHPSTEAQVGCFCFTVWPLRAMLLHPGCADTRFRAAEFAC